MLIVRVQVCIIGTGTGPLRKYSIYIKQIKEG
jgi:hypothetical protein